MQREKGHFNPFRKSAIGSLLIGLVLLLDAMAVCPSLHEVIHKDAGKANHTCAVTMFTQGKVDTATIDVPTPVAAVLIEATLQVEFSVFGTTTENLPPSRAPPILPVVS